jgi:hypothetical protein
MAGAKKILCRNPNTGSAINISEDIYILFENAIRKVLVKNPAMTFGEMMEAVHLQFNKDKTPFNKSVEWYGVTVKNDLQCRGLVEVWMEKGKKRHKWAGS